MDNSTDQSAVSLHNDGERRVTPVVPFLTSCRCYANWFITEFCNYRCFYCTNHHIPRPIEKWDIGKVLQTLLSTGKKWCLGFTGGEPFLYPEFFSMCKRAVQEDFTLYIATNLSPPHQVNEFIDGIDPGMVEKLAIALHILEREKHDGVSPFLKLIDKLRHRGFPFEVQYVMHPLLFPRFEADIAFFTREGITIITKPFQGEYAGKLYPDSYREEERELILKSDPDVFRRGLFYAKGISCNAGRFLVNIDKDGTIYRCVSEKTILGSCSTSIELFAAAHPCKAPCCSCFGWDLIANESFKNEMRKKLSNKGHFWIRARRYLGAWKRRVLGRKKV